MFALVLPDFMRDIQDALFVFYRTVLRRRRLVSLCFTMGVLALSVGFVRDAWHYNLRHNDSPMREELNGFMQNNGFFVRDVVVSGLKFVSKNDVLAAANIVAGRAISQLQVSHVRDRLLNLTGVADVSVQVLLPDTVHIYVREYTPYAYHQLGGQLQLVSVDGNVVQVSPESGLPYIYIVGDGAQHHIQNLEDLLQKAPDVRSRLHAAVWEGGRRWTLRLNSGVEVLLGEGGKGYDLAYLEDLQKKHRLLDKQVARIDLRIPGAVLVRQGDVASVVSSSAFDGRYDAVDDGLLLVQPKQRLFRSEL